MRRGGLVAAVALVALATVGLAACGDDADIPGRADVADSLPDSVATVRSTSSGLEPAMVEVTAGEGVTFTNDDDVPHRIVAIDASFDTGIQEPGDSTLVVFGEPGTVEFEDALDPDRTGEVRVAPPSQGS
jgi:plastocyanin